MGKKRLNKATEVRTAKDTYKHICEDIVEAWLCMTDIEDWLAEEKYDSNDVDWSKYPNLSEMLRNISIPADLKEDMEYTLNSMLEGSYYEAPEEGYDTTNMVDYVQAFNDRGIDIISLYFEEKTRVWKAYMTYLGAMGEVELAKDFLEVYKKCNAKEPLIYELKRRELYNDVAKVIENLE